MAKPLFPSERRMRTRVGLLIPMVVAALALVVCAAGAQMANASGLQIDPNVPACLACKIAATATPAPGYSPQLNPNDPCLACKIAATATPASGYSPQLNPNDPCLACKIAVTATPAPGYSPQLNPNGPVCIPCKFIPTPTAAPATPAPVPPTPAATATVVPTPATPPCWISGTCQVAEPVIIAPVTDVTVVETVPVVDGAEFTVNTAPVSNILNCGQIATQDQQAISSDPGDAAACFVAAYQSCVYATLTVQFNVAGPGGQHDLEIDPSNGCSADDQAVPTTDSNPTAAPVYGSCGALSLVENNAPAIPIQLSLDSCTGIPPFVVPLV